MLRTKYDLEVRNYFLDNGDWTFELHVAIEGLVFTNGIPTSGTHDELPDNMHLWRILDHIVVYKLDGNVLRVRTVKPL